jgi:hypothetical protein
MPRATIVVVTDRPGEWELVEAWINRWRDQMAVCPEEPAGCWCCVAIWDVDAPKEALSELPQHLFAGSDWASPK